MKKIIKVGMDGNIIEPDKVKSKAKPKIWDDTATKAYWLLRDRLIYKTADEETRVAIRDRYKC